MLCTGAERPPTPAEAPSVAGGAADRGDPLKAWPAAQRESVRRVLDLEASFSRPIQRGGPSVAGPDRPLRRARLLGRQGDADGQRTISGSLVLSSSGEVAFAPDTGPEITFSIVNGIWTSSASEQADQTQLAALTQHIRDVVVLRDLVATGPWEPGKSVTIAGEEFRCIGSDAGALWFAAATEYTERSAPWTTYPPEAAVFHHLRILRAADGKPAALERVYGLRDPESGALYLRRTRLDAVTYE